MSYDLIREAILEKKIIHATYRGQHREMCPHVLGRKNGKPQALFYQFGGESNSRPIQPDGSPDNWRCLELALLSDVRIVEGAIGTPHQTILALRPALARST